MPLLDDHPSRGYHLAGHHREHDRDDAQPEPDLEARHQEGVGGDDVKNNVAEIAGKGHNIEEDIADREEVRNHSASTHHDLRPGGGGNFGPPHPSPTSLQDNKDSNQDGALSNQTLGDVKFFSGDQNAT